MMLFDKFYLMNYQPPVEREVKCNGDQTKVPVQSINIMVYGFLFILRYDLIMDLHLKCSSVNLPILM